MGILSLILAGAGVVCLAMSARGLAVLAFAAAVAVWLVPNLGGGGPPLQTAQHQCQAKRATP